MIIVIDYDVGNVKSVCNAFDRLEIPNKLSRKKGDIESASGLVLPGVAAFGYAMKALGDVTDMVKAVVAKGKPIIGICVGYQLLFEGSCEHGGNKGLGFIKGDVVNLPQGRTIPHMGWNQVELLEDMRLFDGLGKAKHFYFAHSYYSKTTDPDAKFAFTEYGFDLPVAVQKGNVYGTQFHPEKSGPTGLRVLKNFYRICEEG